MRATAIVTVKRLDSAKQRLAEGVGPGTRRALAEAMLFDTLGALRRSQLIERTLVVTGDSTAAQIAGSFDLEVLDDPADAGQSEAAAIGVARALSHGAEAVVLLPADCPLLDPAELDSMIAELEAPAVIVVPDRHGVGTNALALAPPVVIEASFGEGSCARHLGLAEAAGVPVSRREVASLAIDLDTPDDLAALHQAIKGYRGGAGRIRGLLHQLDRAEAATP